MAAPEERAAALAWAAECRDRRSDLRLRLARGECSLAEALGPTVAGDPQLGLVKLLVVLESLPGARKVDTRRRLGELGLAETTPLRSLTEEERRRVLEHFPLGATAGSPS